MVIESLRCGGTLDGQLRETRPVTGQVSNSVQALRGVPAEMGAGRRRLYAGWKQGRDFFPFPFGLGPSACPEYLHSAGSPFVRYTEAVFDPDAHVPRPNRSLIYFGACLIAGMRLARERQVNVRVIPIGTAIGESVDLAHEIYNCVFRRVPREMRAKITADDVRVGMVD